MRSSVSLEITETCHAPGPEPIRREIAKQDVLCEKILRHRGWRNRQAAGNSKDHVAKMLILGGTIAIESIFKKKKSKTAGAEGGGDAEDD